MAQQPKDKWTDVGQYVPNNIPVETANAVWQKLDAALHPAAATKNYRQWLLAAASLAAILLAGLVVFLPWLTPQGAKTTTYTAAPTATKLEQKLTPAKKEGRVLNASKKIKNKTTTHYKQKAPHTSNPLEKNVVPTATIFTQVDVLPNQPTIHPPIETPQQETATVEAKRRVIHIDDITTQKPLVDIQKTANQKRIFSRINHNDIQPEPIPHNKQKLFSQLVNDWQQP